MIEIKIFEQVNLKGCTFVEGFPGIGLVGPMTISYMIDKLHMRYIGYLESQSFPPLISIHKAQPMPPIRVYYADKEKIFTIFAEFSIPIELIAELSEVIYQFIEKNGVTSIYSIGGLPMQNESEKIPFIITSNVMSTRNASSNGLKPIEEGVATGVSALLLVKATMDKLQDTCIMVPVRQNLIDPIYAEIAIQSLNKLMNLNIDITDLDKEAKAVESKIKEIISKHKETHDNYKKAAEDSGPSMYA